MFFFWAPTCQATPKPRLERFDTARTCDAAINPVRDTECPFRLVATGWFRSAFVENVGMVDGSKEMLIELISRDIQHRLCDFERLFFSKLIMWFEVDLKLETTGLWYCFDLIWRESSTYLPSSSFFIFCEGIFLNIHTLSAIRTWRSAYESEDLFIIFLVIPPSIIQPIRKPLNFVSFLSMAQFHFCAKMVSYRECEAMLIKIQYLQCLEVGSVFFKMSLCFWLPLTILTVSP